MLKLASHRGVDPRRIDALFVEVTDTELVSYITKSDIILLLWIETRVGVVEYGFNNQAGAK